MQASNLLAYLLESGICLTAFWVLYRSVLFNGRSFTAKRIYLIGTILISSIIPLIHISAGPASYLIPEYSYSIGKAITGTIIVTPKDSGELALIELLAILYLIGVAFNIFKFLFRIAQLLIFAARSPHIKQDGFYLIDIEGNQSPFSFFRFIFINRNGLNSNDLASMTEHEKVHGRQLHSLDIILAELLICVQWFNPVAWACRRSLKELHEHIADSEVIKQGFDHVQYLELILRNISGKNHYKPASYFNYSNIYRRFEMLKNKQSGRFSHLRPLIALPIAMILFTVFPAMKYHMIHLFTTTRTK